MYIFLVLKNKWLKLNADCCTICLSEAFIVNDVNNEIKNKLIDRTFSDFDRHICDSRSSRSREFYFSIVLCNIVILVLASLYVVKIFGKVSFAQVLDTLDYRYLCIVVAVLVLVVLIRILPSLVHIKRKTRLNLFSTLLKCEIVNNFYRNVSIYNSTGKAWSAIILNKRIENKELSIDVVHSRHVYDLLASLIYLLAVIALISIFAFDRLWVWIVVAIVLAVLKIIRIGFNVAFIRNGERVISFIGGVCKLLYKMHFVKEVDVVYNKMVNRLILNARAFKQDNSLIFTSIIVSMINIFLNSLIYYLIFLSIGNGSWMTFLLCIFGSVVLTSICDVFPTPNGTLIFEILFILILGGLYLSEYMFVGLIISRIVVYFIEVIVFTFVQPLLHLKKYFSIKNEKNP